MTGCDPAVIVITHIASQLIILFFQNQGFCPCSQLVLVSGRNLYSTSGNPSIQRVSSFLFSNNRFKPKGMVFCVVAPNISIRTVTLLGCGLPELLAHRANSQFYSWRTPVDTSWKRSIQKRAICDYSHIPEALCTRSRIKDGSSAGGTRRCPTSHNDASPRSTRVSHDPHTPLRITYADCSPCGANAAILPLVCCKPFLERAVAQGKSVVGWMVSDMVAN